MICMQVYINSSTMLFIKWIRSVKSAINISITFRSLFASLVADLGAFHFGFGLSYPSPIASEVIRKGLLSDQNFPIFTSLLSLGAVVGSLVCIPFLQWFGRKAVIMLNSIFGAVGWLLIAVGSNGTELIVGRFFSGMSVGIYSVVVPIYIGELAHYKTKALITNSFSIVLRLGVVICYVLGIFISFRILALVPVILILVQVVLMSFQPYSPTWLFSRNLDKRGKQALISLRSTHCDILEECDAIKSILNESQIGLRAKLKILAEPYHLKALGVGLTMVAAVQCTGIPVYLSYASQLYSTNKLLDSNTAPTLLGVFMVLGTLIASMLFDRVGRKSLTILSAIGTVFCTSCLGIGYWVTERSPPCQTPPLAVYNATIVGHSGCLAFSIWALINLNMLFFLFGLGWGSLLWVLLAELFPIRVKTVVSSLAQVNLWVVTFIITLIWPYLEFWFGTSGAFLLFAVINSFSLLFVVLFIPETKGKPIDEIERLFQERTIFCDPLCICNIYEERFLTLKYTVSKV